MTLKTVSTLTLVLSGLAGASNPIFGGSAFVDCEDCLDRVYNYCPGSYTSKGFAQCLCDGQGAVDFIQCQALCSRYDSFTGGSVGAKWQGYCIYFYPELCPDTKQWVDPAVWEGACGSGSGSGSGSGPGDDSGSGSGSGSNDGDDDDSGSGSGSADDDEDDVTSSEVPSFDITTTTSDPFPEATTTSETTTDSTTTTTSGTTTTTSNDASGGQKGVFSLGALLAIGLPILKGMML